LILNYDPKTICLGSVSDKFYFYTSEKSLCNLIDIFCENGKIEVQKAEEKNVPEELKMKYRSMMSKT